MERNIHVFNHFAFILNYLQPTVQPSIPSLFSEYSDYKYITIGEIEKFEFAPIIPDNIWKNSEGRDNLDKLCDSDEIIGLF